ncbi:MAG: Uma2 family endonuclease [Syntrophobacteraceae bacterium]|nr:Uma2 family endonuclease [Syntrophobacteraceae bacterium]
MEWREVVNHPSLKNLPFKIETNEWGKIMMAPASYAHGVYQGRIYGWFERHAGGGMPSTECPVETSKGVRVADVAWAGTAFLKKHGVRKLSLPESPEVIVEIESPSNSVAELEEKRQLYFEKGAKEFWLCDEDGHVRFFNPSGELDKSELFGQFPGHIEIKVV